MRLTDPADLALLPDGTTLTVPGIAEPVLWLRAYARPHPDPDTGLWRLPRNLFTEYDVDAIEANLPDTADTRHAAVLLQGDEYWLSTLRNPHDTTDTDS